MDSAINEFCAPPSCATMGTSCASLPCCSGVCSGNICRPDGGGGGGCGELGDYCELDSCCDEWVCGYSSGVCENPCRTVDNLATHEQVFFAVAVLIVLGEPVKHLAEQKDSPVLVQVKVLAVLLSMQTTVLNVLVEHVNAIQNLVRGMEITVSFIQNSPATGFSF